MFFKSVMAISIVFANNWFVNWISEAVLANNIAGSLLKAPDTWETSLFI